MPLFSDLSLYTWWVNLGLEMGILLSQRIDIAIDRITEFCKIPRGLAEIQEVCKSIIDPPYLSHLLVLMVWHQDLSYFESAGLWWAGYPPEAWVGELQV